MEIPLTERRYEIQNTAFILKDWSGLERLGLRIVGDGGSVDCLGYVLKTLNIPAHDGTYQEVWKSKRFAYPIRGIILYRPGDSKTVQNHGLYDGKKVISKWGNDAPVIEHDIADVPAGYGDVAEFVEVNADLIIRLRRASIISQEF